MPTYRTVDLVYGQTGQKVYVYPAELGVPTSATCDVFRGDQGMDDDPEFSPTVTIDSVSTTLTSACGPSQANPTRLVVAAVTTIDPGVSYLADNNAEQRELITPKKVDATALHVDHENELRYEYPVGATLKGIRMEFDVDSEFIQNANKLLLPEQPSYKAVFSYTQSSVPKREYVYLRVVRQLSRVSVTLRDLQKYWSDIASEEPRNQRGQGYAPQIDAAEDVVRERIKSFGRDPAEYHDTEIYAGAKIRATFWIVALYLGIAPGRMDPAMFEMKTREEFDSYMLRHYAAQTTPKVSETTDGSVRITTRHPLWTTG